MWCGRWWPSERVRSLIRMFGVIFTVPAKMCSVMVCIFEKHNFANDNSAAKRDPRVGPKHLFSSPRPP
jgi:hypothetical protein